MSVTRNILQAGDGVNRPVKGDEVTVSFNGYLYDANNKGSHCKGDWFKEMNRFKFTISVEQNEMKVFWA
ncbi:hypothetical protein GX50_05166 [[Emmonsia] crescens]|uniref:Uncharacterized protein n=1 Tax=[Emmonsia] crescens TaxID=73230 RepID=A0A2B7ZF83_9EURO|nr:hypothetical protein GX50_05166 [Emmonsia crescens]